MNDMSVTRVPMPMTAGVGKPLPPADPSSTNSQDDVGKALPVTADKIDTEATEAATAAQNSQDVKSEKASAEELEFALKTVNEFVQTVQRDLHFSIDNDSEQTVVKVVESSSGDIIRQIPDEAFLELARKMKEQGHVNLVDATG